MTAIETLGSVQGRALLRDIHRELRYERHMGVFGALSILWRICTTERELIHATRRDVVILHPLGVFSGTALWMQEVVNRSYYTAINAFVYAGAAFLLVAVGLNRTRVIETPSLVVAGVIIEAVLLAILFLVMFFSPPEDAENLETQAGGGSASEDLLREMGEIGRDYAAMAVQLETIAATLNDLVERQDQMIQTMREGVDAAVSAVAPNPGLMQAMMSTTESLEKFTAGLGGLSDRLSSIEQQEIERLVRSEFERLLTRTILDSHERTSAPPKAG